MEQLVYLLSNVGFPIVICLYLLMRIEEKLETLSNAISSLGSAITSMRDS